MRLVSTCCIGVCKHLVYHLVLIRSDSYQVSAAAAAVRVTTIIKALQVASH